MNGTHCDGNGGWTRVAYLNMTESGACCPPGLKLNRYNNINHGVCGRQNTSSPGCSSTNFSTLGLNYHKVCGQLRGYQYHTPDALHSLSEDIDSYYVDGISITYGQNPRTHIWTYAAGLTEDRADEYACPCNTGYDGGINVSSSFIGNHYYCESGLNTLTDYAKILQVNDTLWDGQNCDSLEDPCCPNSTNSTMPTNFKMPWFNRVLDDMTQDGIELRVCGNEENDDVPLDIIELYVL